MAIEKIKRNKGSVYRAVFFKGKNRISKTFARKLDAQSWLQDKERQFSGGFKGKIGLKQACELWLSNHSKIKKSPSSHREDRSIIERRMLPFFGDMPLDEILEANVEKWICNLLSKGLKPTTVNSHLQRLRAILNYFIKRRYLSLNVVSLVGLLPVTESSFDYLSFDEANQFLTFASDKYQHHKKWVYTLYLLAMNTGMRWGEIAALKWDKVDFQYKRITIARSYCKVSNQIRETTKGRRIRYVGINACLLPRLQELSSRNHYQSYLVFQNKGSVISLANFKRDHFEPDLKKSKIRKIRFHDLRHTFASHFAMKGGSIYDLQKLLGHSHIKTTERYAHLSPESIVNRTELVSIEGDRNKLVSLKDWKKRNSG